MSDGLVPLGSFERITGGAFFVWSHRMSLMERLSELVRTCLAGPWIETHEHEVALAELLQLCRLERFSYQRIAAAGILVVQESVDALRPHNS